ncbi:ABC transporter ATP-binding protein [Amycolatopsis samaneae]|uniref:ABC transporter ATP-binding protein n=1 Tax=Amycolatopsis samaneae TaxID=664691 RepID=A0ABW5GW56_9PSEU
MLVAENLEKRYGEVVALDGFDLTVAPGEVVGLIGHNGAGKTTFLEVVSGQLRPDRGRVTVCGVDIREQPRRARALLGVAPQELALYPRITVREHLVLFGRLAGLRPGRLRREVDTVAGEMLLTELLDRRVAELSGGQRRRVQTAAALVHRPPVLLLDEPTVGADPATREALLAAVRARADEGASVCYTTHYLPELERMRAGIAIAIKGRVVTRDTGQRLLAGLPSELRVRFARPAAPDLVAAGGWEVVEDELRKTTREPGRDLAALVGAAGSGELVSVAVRPPTFDDLYHRLATEVSDAR